MRDGALGVKNYKVSVKILRVIAVVGESDGVKIILPSG
jgi:hypothetical protein